MKPRILNLGLLGTHERIVNLSSVIDPVAISDYDAFCFDPESFADEVVRLSSPIGPATYQAALNHNGHEISAAVRRRRVEVADLLNKKGGIVLCFLRPNDLGLSAQSAAGFFNFDKYALVKGISSDLDSLITLIRAGSGESVRALNSHTAVSQAYLQILKGHLSFEASFQRWPDASDNRTVLAENSVGNPVAVELEYSAGRVCFLPTPTNVPADRLGAAIVQTVDRFIAGELGTPEPSWVTTEVVPGEKEHDPEISLLENTLGEISGRIQELKGQRQRLSDFRRLLFGYGRAVLEPAVRSSFREMGLVVPEPDEYPQDWDVFLTTKDGHTAIVEVEGSEGPVDVWKYRQLLDYVDEEAQEGRKHKGILVGNGYRLLPLDATERKSQFSEHALRGAERNNFCLVPTSELFKAVCAILEDPQNAELKKQICDSLFSVSGPWKFTR